MLKELVRLANHLDSKGLVKEADYLDNLVKNAGLWDKFKRSFKELVGISNVSECSKKCALAMLMLGEPVRTASDDKCTKMGYEYTANINEKIGILNALIELEKSGDYKEFKPKEVLKKYLKDPRHTVEFYSRASTGETMGLLQSLLGLDTVSEIFMGGTAEALKQKTVNQRITKADAPHLAAKKNNCVSRSGQRIPCPEV